MVVGRLGLLYFDGWFVYVGSAQGPGGLKRVERHLSYRHRPEAPLRWHVDALLGCGALREAVMAVTSEPRECVLAEALGRALSPAFEGFGSSDCSCSTHLFRAPSRRKACRCLARQCVAWGWSLRQSRLWPERGRASYRGGSVGCPPGATPGLRKRCRKLRRWAQLCARRRASTGISSPPRVMRMVS